jgi:hypothetical protein
MTAPQKPPTKYDRQCVFVGRRVASGGKTSYKFELLPKREPMYFGKIKGVYIGHTYECTENSISGKPNRVERERESNPEWEAQDALVDAANEEKRAQRKWAESSKPTVKKAIEALKPLMRGLTIFERELLIKHLCEKTRG